MEDWQIRAYKLELKTLQSAYENLRLVFESTQHFTNRNHIRDAMFECMSAISNLKELLRNEV